MAEEIVVPISNYARVKAWRALNPHKRAEEARRYREKHPEKVAANSKRWREKHIEIRRPIEAEKARRQRQDPEGNRRRGEAFRERRKAKQEVLMGRPRPDCCELCNEPGYGKHHSTIVFDHCHITGNPRGWLCDRCNKVLGMVKDNPNLLIILANYLREHSGETKSESQKCVA